MAKYEPGDFVKYRTPARYGYAIVAHGCAWGPGSKIGYVVDTTSYDDSTGVYDITPIMGISPFMGSLNSRPNDVDKTVYYWPDEGTEVFMVRPRVKDEVLSMIREIGILDGESDQ